MYHPVKIKKHYNNGICNNCGKYGHVYKNCTIPILSFGVIPYRINNNNVRQYLMIRRKDTFGYIDYLRGKYSIHNTDYIINMMRQMTDEEKKQIQTNKFELLWNLLWKHPDKTSNAEKNNSKIIFETIQNTNIQSLIDESNKYDTWNEPEWGFPKGRRNYLEPRHNIVRHGLGK